ncbi:MAG TPA: hypothetical protein DEO88_06000, partial [Syntrophobacteraceae bacterium]|nr:hypothetical protein [Syntrophobacteraceae bacterium]
AKAAWQILAELEATLAPYPRANTLHQLQSEIASDLNVALWEDSDWTTADGRRVGFNDSDAQPFASVPTDAADEQEMDDRDLVLLRTDWFYGTEELSTYSDLL